MSSVDRSGGNSAQKWLIALVSAVVVVVVAWMTMEAPAPRVRPAEPDAGAAASATPAAPTTSAATDAEDAGVTDDDLDGGLVLVPPSLGDASLMPAGAPRTVKIGVVLVTFQGAEGAPPNARSKRDALALAERLSQDARTDFRHAVTAGDPGSSEDIGRLPRGVLDPRTEVSVFALSPGEVSEVLETPRGYWIVKRID